MIIIGYLGISTEEFNPQILYICRADNKAGYIGKHHCHDFLELSYLVSGKSTYTIDNSTFEVKAGDLMVFNPEVYHQEVTFADIHVTEVHIAINKLLLNGLAPNFILPKDASPLVSLVKYAAEFNSCMSQIILEQERRAPGHELVLKALVMKLLVILLRELYTAELGADSYKFSFEPSEKSNIVSTILAFMEEHYDEEISLDKLSKNTYLSPVYLSKIFKEETGDSPINYLINIRLNKARELLEEGNLSIKAIAKTVGYNDAYYFSKLFKKHFGITPLKLKQKGA